MKPEPIVTESVESSSSSPLEESTEMNVAEPSSEVPATGDRVEEASPAMLSQSQGIGVAGLRTSALGSRSLPSQPQSPSLVSSTPLPLQQSGPLPASVPLEQSGNVPVQLQQSGNAPVQLQRSGTIPLESEQTLQDSPSGPLPLSRSILQPSSSISPSQQPPVSLSSSQLPIQDDTDLPSVRSSVVAPATEDITSLDFSTMSKSKQVFYLNGLLMKSSSLLDSIPV